MYFKGIWYGNIALSVLLDKDYWIHTYILEARKQNAGFNDWFHLLVLRFGIQRKLN